MAPPLAGLARCTIKSLKTISDGANIEIRTAGYAGVSSYPPLFFKSLVPEYSDVPSLAELYGSRVVSDSGLKFAMSARFGVEVMRLVVVGGGFDEVQRFLCGCSEHSIRGITV